MNNRTRNGGCWCAVHKLHDDIDWLGPLLERSGDVAMVQDYCSWPRACYPYVAGSVVRVWAMTQAVLAYEALLSY